MVRLKQILTDHRQFEFRSDFPRDPDIAQIGMAIMGSDQRRVIWRDGVRQILAHGSASLSIGVRP